MISVSSHYVFMIAFGMHTCTINTNKFTGAASRLQGSRYTEFPLYDSFATTTDPHGIFAAGGFSLEEYCISF